MATQAASALKNARLFRETQERLKKIEALRNIDLAIAGSLDVKITIRVLLEEVTKTLGVDAADVLSLNPYTQMLEYLEGRGFKGGAITKTKFRIGEGYAGRAALEGKVMGIEDLRTVDDFIRKDLLVEEGFVAFCCAPLVTKGRCLGVLKTFHRSPVRRDEE